MLKSPLQLTRKSIPLNQAGVSVAKQALSAWTHLEIPGLQKAAELQAQPCGRSPVSTVSHRSFWWAVTHPSALGPNRHFYTEAQD